MSTIFDVVDKCAGCANITAIDTCKIYAKPLAKQHVLGGCASQTNRTVKVVGKKKINALKASKRAAAGK